MSRTAVPFLNYAIIAAVFLLLPASRGAFCSAQDDNGQPHAEVSIDGGAHLTKVSPLTFGGFLEHFDDQVYGGVFEPGSSLSDESGFRRDVIEALKELKLSIVRWPGGCFASGYHWRDGVGPKRVPVRDPVWGVTDPNTFGTDEFIAWCRAVGCQPYICTNAGNGTPEEMRDWVAYCNEGKDAADRVRYWSVGNENWGSHEIGASTPEKWGPLVKRSAELMRSVDPTIQLVAAATPDPNWTLPLLKVAGDQLNLIAIHEYWFLLFAANSHPTYLDCIVKSEGPERTLRHSIGLLDQAGVRGRIKIAYDEWNLRGWHHPGFPRTEVGDPNDAEAQRLINARQENDVASQYTMADALFSASFLNACMRHADDVGMANIAPIVNTRGPLFVHPGGIVKRTTFHVLAMYAKGMHDHVAPTESTGSMVGHGNQRVSIADAVATCDQSGQSWRIALVNRHPSKSASFTIRLKGEPLDGSYEANQLEGPSPDAYNDVDAPNRVTPQDVKLTFRDGAVSLPPHSLTILHVESEPRN